MSHLDRLSPNSRDLSQDPWSGFSSRSDHANGDAHADMHISSNVQSNGGFPVAMLSRAGSSFGSRKAAPISAPRNPFAFVTAEPEPAWGMPTPTEERIVSHASSSSRGSSSAAQPSTLTTNDFSDPLTNHTLDPLSHSTHDKAPATAASVEQEDGEQDEQTFVYSGGDGSTNNSPSLLPEASVSATSQPDRTATQMPATPPSFDYEHFVHLCSHGPLTDLEAFVTASCSAPPQGSNMSLFALANDPNPNSGLLPLHLAAKEGKTEIVKWLINDAGAIVEMEDREGETALHKAAMAGRLSVVSFLLAQGANANAKDNDGWTALHNACSRGYLDIVRVLIDTAKADVDLLGGRGGWTALMNAASKGHLPIVRTLISKYQADPFIRNASGETAFDVAAATFEVYICEVLERYEAERWAAHDHSNTTSQTDDVSAPVRPYDPLALHSTVPIVLHENQRLDTRLQTLAMHGGKPRWSSSSAARSDKSDRRSPTSMPPGPLALSQTKHTAMRREDIMLPTRAMPYKLRLRMRLSSARQRAAQSRQQDDLASTPTPDSVLRSRNAERNSLHSQGNDIQDNSHFWLCEWQLDTTHPLVDASQGWQYAQCFDALDDKWSSQPPPPLERLLDGRGLSASVTRALTGGAGLVPAQGDQEASTTGWVRRRRWVRVMRRRLDIEFQDELEACESALASGQDTDTAAADVLNTSSNRLSTAAMMAAQESARIECSQLGPTADYLSRARALAGSSASSGATPADALGEEREELARRISRLVMAVTELRAAFEDTDTERRAEAEEVRKEFVTQLGQLRQAAGLDEEEDDDDHDDDDDEEFIYPNSYKDDGASVITRMASASAHPTDRPALPQRQSSSASVFGGAVAPSEAGTSMAAGRSADLAANREFRVPTNEAPNKVGIRTGPALREQNLQPQWQRDQQVTECLGCGRRFTFFLRKHHCRRCGRIFCDPCSSKRAQLSAQDLVVDPSLPNMAAAELLGPTRICNNCHAEMQLPAQLQSLRGAESLVSYQDSLESGNHLSAPPASDVSSRASELTDCPVCSTALASIGGSEAQEAHVRNCLENGGGGSLQGGRYLVYKLPDTSPIIGKECSICMEDFLAASVIARLPCLCYFHRGCIDSWFKRGRECPVHARSW